MKPRKYASAITVVAALILVSTALLLVRMRQVRGQQANASAVEQPVEETKMALRRGGYKEAARIKGHYVGTVNPDWDWVVFDLESLTKASAAVGCGTPHRIHATPSTGGCGFFDE